MEKRVNVPAISCFFWMALILALGVSSTSSYAETYQYTIVSGSYEIVDAGDGYQEIQMEGFGQLLDPGKPKLPSKVFSIAIPPGVKVDSAEMTGVGLTELDGTYQIVPSPMVSALSATEGEIEANRFEYEQIVKDAYASDTPYPSEEGVFKQQGAYRKYNLVQVRYSPFSYEAKTGKLYLYNMLDVTVTYSYSSAVSSEVEDMMEDYVPEAEERAAEFIINYQDAQKWYPAPFDGPVATTGGFVIITTDALEDSVWPIRNWETCKGRDVHVETVEDIDDAFSGADRAERIRNFLRTYLSSWNILKVMLVGHITDVPMRYTYPSGPDGPDSDTTPWELEDRVPTDYYYAELSWSDFSSWNSNHDSMYGQQGVDNVQFPNEVDVGRIPWSDPDTVEAICMKMAEFEYSTDMTFKLNYLFTGAFFWDDTDNAVVKTYIINNALDTVTYGYPVRIYEQDPSCWDSIYWSNYAMSRYITRDVWGNDYGDGPFGYVNLAGHGSHYGVYFKERHPTCSPEAYFYGPDDCSHLDDSHPSIVFSNACSTAWPEDNNLGKRLLEQGAVSFVGSTRVAFGAHGWNDPSDGYCSSMDWLFTDKAARTDGSRSSVGWSHQHALRDMYNLYNWDNSWWQFFEWNIYSNPDLWLEDRPSSLPNLDYFYRTGWDYPIVPRSAAGATNIWCPVTATLPGNTANTYFNWTVENNGASNAPLCKTSYYVDGRFIGYRPAVIAAGGSDYIINWDYGPTIQGGRHSLYYDIDSDEEVWETSESDNWWGRQFVWSPYGLSDDAPIYRSAPPTKNAWASPYWYNNDGFNFYVGQVHPNKWWSAVGILPYNSSADYDLRLWDIGDYTGSEGGFGGGYLEYSSYGGSSSDFVIVNDNMVPAGTYYAGVINDNDGTGNFHIEEATSTKIYAGTNGPYSMTSPAVLDIYEYNINPPGDYGIKLEQTSGTCDLGMSLYDDETVTARKSGYMTGGYANSNGDGEDEFMEVTIPDSGFHGLAVWKVDSSDYSKTATYQIKAGACATPSTPANPSPVDGATDVSVDADLDWGDCTDTEYYEVWLKEGSGAWMELGETETSAWSLATLNEATHYDWFVRAWNLCGESSYVYWDFITEDNTPPTPDPMTWATEPHGASTSSISMVATTATDDTSPVEYYFQCMTAQGNSSVWQTSTSYTDTGLPPNMWCGYRVMAGDSAPTPNTTGYSGTRYAYTWANLPGAAGFSNITQTSIQANWTADGNPAGTEYYCENTTAGTNSGWTTNTYWNSTGLNCGTSYSFLVKARNGDGVDTAWTNLGSQSTLSCPDITPPDPDPMTWESKPDQTGTSSISMEATTASDPSPPISYYFHFTSSPTGGTGGTDSGWQSGTSCTSYTNTGLSTNHQYGYEVKARDDKNNETGYSLPIVFAYTDIETLSGITFGTITENSIQAMSASTPSGLTLGSSGLLIENVTNENDSGWKQDNNYWTSALLSPNTQYEFRARARNGDEDVTPYCSTHDSYTLANSPGADVFSNITENSIQANWTANGNPAGTEYYCENTTKGTDSGWTTNTYWNSTELDCGTSYLFRVKARNGDHVETAAWTDLGGQSTDPCPSACEGDFDEDGDVDGSDLAVFAADGGGTTTLAQFAADFGRTDCLE